MPLYHHQTMASLSASTRYNSMASILEEPTKRHHFFPLKSEGTTEVKLWLAQTICGRNPYKIFASLPRESEEESAVKQILDRCVLSGLDLYDKSRQELELELRRIGFDRFLALSLAVKIEESRVLPSNRCSDPLPRNIPEFHYLGPTICPILSPEVREQFINSSPGRYANAACIRQWLLSWFKHADIKDTRGDRWMRMEIHCEGNAVKDMLVKLVQVGGTNSLTSFFLGCGFGEEVAQCLAQDVGKAVMTWG